MKKIGAHIFFEGKNIYPIPFKFGTRSGTNERF